MKEECLSKLILFGEASLRRALAEFIDHFHGERNHQGKGNVLLFPAGKVGKHKPRTRVRCRERLGGLMKYTAMSYEYFGQTRDTRFCADFRKTLATGGVKCLRLPPRSPNLNAFAERWVRSVKSECLSHFILFGEGSLRRAMKNFCEHYHEKRNHQGESNALLFPTPVRLEPGRRRGIRCRERLGGLLRYYSAA
jgi:hypothetical protein